MIYFDVVMYKSGKREESFAIPQENKLTPRYAHIHSHTDTQYINKTQGTNLYFFIITSHYTRYIQ